MPYGPHLFRLLWWESTTTPDRLPGTMYLAWGEDTLDVFLRV